MYDDNEVVSMLIQLINEAKESEMEWNDVEESLGYLNFDDKFDYLDDVRDKDGDINYWKTAARNEDIASNLVIPTLKIQKLFSEWVEDLHLSSIEPKADFRKLLENQDQFFTFNYTETLEEVYNITEENICHIHGTQDEEIFFGHGNTKDYTECYMQKNIGSENYLNDINDKLRKRTDIALQNNINFFENMKKAEINKIYSFGFSFNEADKIYLEKIFRYINTEHITWYFNDYDINFIDRWSWQLKQIGFKGDFDTFHVD